MALDPKVKNAIEEAVSGLDQSDHVATQLIAWIGAVMGGNESLDDRESVNRHLQLLFESVKIDAAD